MAEVFNEDFSSGNWSKWTIHQNQLTPDVVSGVGRMNVPTGGSGGRYAFALAGAPSNRTQEIKFRMLIGTVTAVHGGAVLLANGYTTGNYPTPQYGYRLQTNGGSTTMVLTRYVNGAATNLVTNIPRPGANVYFWVRFRGDASNNTLYVKTWLDGDPEPTAWTWSGVDPSYSAYSGKPGLWAYNGTSSSAGGPVYFDDVVTDDLTAAAVNVSYAATAATLSVDAPNPAVTAVRHVAFSAGAATVSVDSPTATVRTQTNTDLEAAIVNDNPVAYYKMEDLSGKDEVGNRTLTLTDIVVGSGYPNGQGHEHNGTTSTASMAAFPSLTGNHSVEVWVKSGPSGFTVDYPTFIRRDGTDVFILRGRGSHFAAEHGPGQAEIYAGGVGLYSGVRIDDGQWHQVVATVNGATVSLYVDGTFRGSVNSGKTVYNYGTGPAYIGPSAVERMIGTLDNLAIYDYALTDVQIADHNTIASVKHVSVAAPALTVDVTAPGAAAVITKDVTATPTTIDVNVTAPDSTVLAQRNITEAAGAIGVDVSVPAMGVRTAQNVTMAAPSFAINVVGEPAAVVTSKHVALNAEAATLTLAVAAPEVVASDTVLMQASAATIEIVTPNARGGDPHAEVSAQVAEMTILVPNGAEAVGGSDLNFTTTAAEITTTILEPSVSNITDVLVQAETIGVRIRLAGFYNREEDKWADYIENSLLMAGEGDSRENYEDIGDRWFRFHDDAGSTTAVDSTGRAGAVYHGSPTLRIVALDDRYAVGLDGIDDYVDLDPLLSRQGVTFVTNTPLPLGMSVEFVVQTTATSGTLFSNGRFGLELTENGMRWVDANNLSGAWTEKFLDIENSKINDNKWHHVVWLMNEGNGRNTLMVDGRVVWSRAAWNNWTPSIPTRIGMRETTYIDNQGYQRTIDLPARPVVANFMEFIIRQRQNYSRDAALRSYYILNNHTLVDAPVANTITVRATQGTKGRGNQKKMLVLYGNSETTDQNGNQHNMFFSSWSGMRVPRGPDGSNDNPHLLYSLFDQEQRHLYPPRPMDYKGYKVYFAHMFEPGRYSSPGIVKNTGEDYFYDNITGEPRYIDVNKDLVVDVEDFDVIHVLHWPAANLDPYLGSDYLPYFTKQDEFDYDRARGLFKDSLRKANSKGVGLWISEAAMAVEFGIAKSYNVHFRDEESYGYRSANRDINSYEYQRDLELGRDILRVAGGNRNGFYHHTYFVRNRRIVGTATGFSEKPTWYVGERIYWQADDQLQAHARAYAHKLEHLPNGLTVGSEFSLMVGANWAGAQNYRDERVHYGLDPNGIVGNVIAKEETTFWTRGQEVPNAHAEVVTTVLVERGTILQGEPTGGRIFVELMDNDWDEDPIYHPAPYNEYINGAHAPGNHSLWDFDDRRNKELFRHDLERGRYIKYYNSRDRQEGTNVSQDYPRISLTELPHESRGPVIGMNDRGLDWLAVKPDTNPGSTQIFASAAEVSVKTEGPTVAVVRHVEVAARPATLKVELRRPVGNFDPNVTINADVVTIGVVGGKYQTIIRAEVAQVDVTSPTPRVKGEGEDFVVYLRSNNITVYLGEDN